MDQALFTFLLAVVPAIILMVYVYYSDKQKEPILLILKSFGYGVLSVLFVFVIHFAIEFLGFDIQTNVFLRAFIAAAFIEEFCKFILLKKLIWNNKHFDEYFDGIVYAVFVSLGFAVVENILYMFVYTPETAIETGFQRAIWAVPAHFLFAVIMGYYFSLARFNPHKQKYYLCLSLFMAVLAHGLYDAFLMLADFVSQFSSALSSLLMIGFYIFDIFLWKIGIKRIKKHQLSDNYNQLKF